MSRTSNGGRLSIAAAVSAVLLAGVITSANAQPLPEVEPPTSESATSQPTDSATTRQEVPVVDSAQSPATEPLAKGVLFQEDFSGDQLPEGWDSLVGDWRVEDGRLLGTCQGGEQARIVFGEH